ncbi:MAG: L-seryl-tRNA(Sec) selenium transferase [Rhizobiales bacterium]|nr:L-seryl-tRNA(Sec) selenium transferase [Hyphomicrobiales bacterium]OJU30042.1 MAG: L-seryl-tRNA(Sec) selenium transferase [Rhizobiales bacterium 68-8]
MPVRRDLPSVDAVLRSAVGGQLVTRHGHQATVAAIRACLAEARAGEEHGLSAEAAADRVGRALDASNAPRLKTVFNLTGTVLHTNLGRALLARSAAEAAAAAMIHPVALEFDVERGGRGKRDDLVRDLLCELTGAEDATLVNNNAAAVLLVLNTLAAGKGAIVSRGELIEIGGAFRLPQIMQSAGARLVEVGTTNRTHRRDYEDAIDAETGLLLKVHTSNYRIEGFTAAVPMRDLAALAHPRDIPLVEDLGSGTLADLGRFGLPTEPTVAESVAAGADLVTFSGDKLLGGPQAGFIVGREALIERINRNPMKRALRIDKIRLAAIEETLRLYRDPDRLATTLPTFRLLARGKPEIEAAARRLAPKLAELLGTEVHVAVSDCASQVGSGAVPGETLPSAGLALRPRAPGGGAVEALAARLRALPMPVIGRISGGAVLLDLRCLEDEDGFLANFQGGGA